MVWREKIYFDQNCLLYRCTKESITKYFSRSGGGGNLLDLSEFQPLTLLLEKLAVIKITLIIVRLGNPICRF